MSKTLFMPKKTAGILLSVLLLIGLAAVPTLAADQPIPAINVSGTGIVSVSPDQAIINFSVVTNSTSAREVQVENARLTNAVIEALTQEGITRENIQTSDYSIWPQYNYSEQKEKPKIIGYKAQNRIQVTSNDLTKVGSIIDIAIKAGVNQVENIYFTKKDSSAAIQEALRKACVDARQKAQSIASALGISLGQILSVHEAGSYYEPLRDRMALGMGENIKGVNSTPIEPGEIKVTRTVNISFAIVQ